MRRTTRAISLGALLSVLASMFVAAPAQAATITVLNQCDGGGGSSCLSDAIYDVRGTGTAPYELTFKLGNKECTNRIGDRTYLCKSARTASADTATSIKWRYRYETGPGTYTAWTETTNTCGNDINNSITYCFNGEHLDTFVVSTPGNTRTVQVHFKLVSGANETIWLANSPDGWRTEYIAESPKSYIPTATISTNQFALKNEPTTISAQNSNPNDGSFDIANSSFAWDMYYIPSFSGFTPGQMTRIHSFSATGPYTIRMRITNRFGNVDTETMTIYVSEPPPSNTPSLSLTNSRVFTNQSNETLDLVWPIYANTMSLEDGTNISANRALNDSPTWDFGWGQVDGETRTLTAKFFDGAGNQLSTQLSQDVTFDSVLPGLNSVSATRTDGALVFSLSATDQHSGLSKVEISNGSTTVEHSYATEITSTLSGSNFTVRVKDLAGNWSASQNVLATTVNTASPAPANNPPVNNPPAADSSPAPAVVTVVAPIVTTPRVAAKSKTSSASVATQAGVAIPAGAKVALTVSGASKKICKVSGGKLVALAPGNCLVTVSVTPKKTKILKKPKAVRTPTTVVVG